MQNKNNYDDQAASSPGSSMLHEKEGEPGISSHMTSPQALRDAMNIHC